MITDRMSRERKRRLGWRLLRKLLAGWDWRECLICGEGFNGAREMGVRPLMGDGYGEIVCWWCGWEGREGALPFMVSWLGEGRFAVPSEYLVEPLASQVNALIDKHVAWRKHVSGP